MSLADEEFDPYCVLGLNVGASEKEIQRRYRELVRQHHPDVSCDTAKAHQRFVRIQQAYRMLMDPQQRARWERRSGITLGTPDITVDQPRSRYERLLSSGRRLLRERRLAEARSAAAAAIELDPFNAEAYRLLAEVYLTGGNEAMAGELYREAELLETQARAERLASSGSPKTRQVPTVPERPSVLVCPILVGGVGAAACLVGMSLTRFSHAPGSFVGLGCAAVFILGLSGTASGLIEPFDELLGLAEFREAGRPPAPGGLYLVVLSALSPYLGVMYYALTALVTESYSRGVLKIYAITFGVSLWAWWIAHKPAAFALVAPSVAFMATLAGWIVGSFVTPREWWRR